MTFSNFALRYHKDIGHWVIYHLKDVCEMQKKLESHFMNYYRSLCVVVDVNVNLDTCIA